MKAPAQERSRRTLDRLMAAAVESFADVGVDRATVAEIVRDAKSSVGSFYGRFSSKDDLVVAVDARLWAETEERWRSALLELAGVAAGGADPSSDSVTTLSMPIAAAPGPSMIELSGAVFEALRPDLEARSRTSAYLERHGFTPASIRVLAHIEAGVLRTLQGARSGWSVADPGMPQFLTGVVLKTATDPNVGSDAPYHLAHVLNASLTSRTTHGGAAEPGSDLPAAAVPEDPDRAAAEPSATEEAPGPGPAKPEAFDIWA